ncbi:MAG: XrtA system polysaccharide deacetylase [Gammaproteobacteria bacterium]
MNGIPVMSAQVERVLINAITVDVEDYFQVSAFEPLIARADWDRWPQRVQANTERLLALFAEAGVRGTFFTLGWVGDRYPALVRRIVAEGHELGCHGYDHIRLSDQTPEQLRAELRRSKDVLEQAAGTSVIGFRAASFSIHGGNLWALAEIAAAGFRYSSSIYPVSHDHYGLPHAPRIPYRPREAPGLLEIPISTTRLWGRNLPAGGGGYFRLLPYPLSRALLRRINRVEGCSANFYTHPWEYDPQQPRPAGMPLKTRFRHYVNQDRALGRLRRLLADFRWAPVREAYACALGQDAGVQP